jgi:hypothetical protein
MKNSQYTILSLTHLFFGFSLENFKTFENKIICIKVVKALCVGLMPEAKGIMTTIKGLHKAKLWQAQFQ